MLKPYQALIAIGMGFTLLAGGLVATEQYLSLNLAEAIHQVGTVYSPPITAGLTAQTKIAQLLTKKADAYLNGSTDITPDTEIAQAWVEAAEGPNSQGEKENLSQGLQALLDIESRLGRIDIEKKHSLVVGDEEFADLMALDLHSLMDSADQLNLQREQDLLAAEDQRTLFAEKEAFVAILYAGETVLFATSILLAIWFRRLINPGVAGALVIMLFGGGTLQTHLSFSLISLESAEQSAASVRHLGKIQAQAAAADLYLHSWFLSRSPTDWQRLYDNTYQIYNENPEDSSMKLIFGSSPDSDLGNEAKREAPVVSLEKTDFLADKILSIPLGGGGSGFLVDELPRLGSPEGNSVLTSYADILKELNQIRTNEVQGHHDQSVKLLVDPSGLNDSFADLDKKLVALQTGEQLNLTNIAKDALSLLEGTTATCLFTALGSVVALWLGLIPRLREYTGL